MNASLRAAIAADRQRIASGARPIYHARWRTTTDGPPTVDVMIRELPNIHAFLPDYDRIGDGARALIARTLEVDPESFDVEVDSDPST